MSNFKIPASENPSTEPSALTQAEMANMSATKRNTILYERTIESLSRSVDYLERKLDESDIERKNALKKLDHYTDDAYKIPLLKRENLEMYVMFALITVSMALGSALISSYPKTSTLIPWQFGLGWGLVGLGATLGIVGKASVWMYYRVKQ